MSWHRRVNDTLRRAHLRILRYAEQTMGMSAIRHHWTADQVAELQQESRHWPRYELIEGELIVTPAPGVEHQLAVQEFLFILHEYVEQQRLGTVFLSPADIRLIPESIVQPDIFVVPPAVGPPLGRKAKWSDVKALVLAVEIVSPSSVRTDRLHKRDLYMRAGLPDYWVVDVDARVVEQWSSQRATPIPCVEALNWQPGGAVEPLTINLIELFRTITGKRIL